MRLGLTDRVLGFSKEKQDIMSAAIDLYKHYLYRTNSTKYAMFAENSNDKSYDEKNDLFNKLFRKQVVKDAYLPESAVEDKNLFKMKHIRELSFALVVQTLDTILPATMINSFDRIAEIQTVGAGNQGKFTIPNTHIFDVYKVARGVRMTVPQTDYRGDYLLTPEPRMITIKANFEDILLGKVDWGYLMVKTAKSFEQKISTEIYTTIAGKYSSLDTNFKEAGFSQTAFTKLTSRIQACNDDSPVVVMGTKVALSSILPSNDYLKMDLGEEYNRYGYIRNFQGVDLMEIPQRITPNTTNFAIANDELYIFSLGVDAPVKIAMEDGGMMHESTDASSFADGGYYNSVRKSWELAVVTSAKYGIMKIS